jgi:ferredoxin-NADP reductase
MTAINTALTPHRLSWMTATVREVIDETPRVKSLVLDVPGWPGHRAGQHVDVRLTAEDGYQAQRSYSIASAPETDGVTLTVERIEEGEVSLYLAGEARAGDRFEIRGPIGGYFVWTPELGGPLLLVAGGSGMVPLMAMLRHRAAAGSRAPARLLYSSRTGSDIIYRAELARLAARGDGLAVVHTLTREQPPGWSGLARRIDRAMLREVGYLPAARARCFICGPTPLVEAVARDLRDLGHAPALIKTERFGPTGR